MAFCSNVAALANCWTVSMTGLRVITVWKLTRSTLIHCLVKDCSSCSKRLLVAKSGWIKSFLLSWRQRVALPDSLSFFAEGHYWRLTRLHFGNNSVVDLCKRWSMLISDIFKSTAKLFADNNKLYCCINLYIRLLISSKWFEFTFS